jgi:nucleoside-diphosphate-sugar epimerase
VFKQTKPISFLQMSQTKLRVFITGGTGFIGSAVVQELLKAGHEVVGLARSESSAQALKSAGASVLEGSLEDLESIKRGAASADAVIHIAFVHNITDFLAGITTDKLVIEAIGETLSGTNRPFVVTSGVPLGDNGQLVTEEFHADPRRFPRLSEVAALPFAERGVRVSIVRPSRLVHGEGDKRGFIPMLIGIARKSGKSAYIGSGESRVQAVHRLDVATLFRLAIEKGTAGSKYQGVGDGGVTFRSIAEAIAKGLNIPAVSIPAEEALNHFGFMGRIFGTDNPASSEATQEALGWKPTHPSLLEDLAKDFYFA